MKRWLLAASLLLTALPTVAAVEEGDPVVFYLAEGAGSSFCEYGLVSEAEPASGSCGSGFAVAAAGVNLAPPHQFTARDTNRTVNLDGNGSAFLRFSPLLAPPPGYEVQVVLQHQGNTISSGGRFCLVTEPCDFPLQGPGGNFSFLNLTMEVRFPTIVGVFTPSMEFGGSDPSRLELGGSWGRELPKNATPSIALPVPVARDLLPPDGPTTFFLQRGSSHCFALALEAGPPPGCIAGTALLEGALDSDAWPVPRSVQMADGAALHLGFGPWPDGATGTGTATVEAAFTVGGRTSTATATCAYSSLPAWCDVMIPTGVVAVAWPSSFILDLNFDVQGSPFVVAGGDEPSTITLGNLTWEPEPVIQNTTEADEGNESPALAAGALVGGLAFVAILRRRR